MHATTDRLDFAPPPTPGMLRALALAVLAHALLLAALTWGVHWKSEPVSVTAEAELWSALPQAAAPRLVEAPPEPPAPPEATRPTPVQAPPPLPDADIALAQKKLRIKQEKQAQVERERELEKQRQEKLKQEKLQLEKKRLQDQREQDVKAAQDKQKLAQETKRKETLQAQQDVKKLEAMRQENMKRMAGLAGASGAPGATGTARQSSGPSAGYAGRIVERIRSNTTFTDSSAGKPTVIVLVRAAPSGAVLSRKVVTPSGNKAWDEAILRAIDKMETLPRDADGKIPAIVLSDGLELKVSL